MSSDKLNQSLDAILSERRKSSARGRGRTGLRRAAPGGRPAAPVGGVKKTVKPVKPAKTNERVNPTAGPAKSGDSKIIVSGLPTDVTEAQIKEYFEGQVGPVKKVLLTYGPNGQSRGIATVISNKANFASRAAEIVDGLKVEKRSLKVEIILGAKEAPAPTQPKKLGDRISQPKSAANAKPKPATDNKAAGRAKAAGNKKGPRAARRGGKSALPHVKKTAEELDQEMADYFDGGDTAMGTNGGAVQPAANETAMDEVL